MNNYHTYNQYVRKIEELGLSNVSVVKLEEINGSDIITIRGGNSCHRYWTEELLKITLIVQVLQAFVIILENDGIEDTWILKIGVNRLL